MVFYKRSRTNVRRPVRRRRIVRRASIRRRPMMRRRRAYKQRAAAAICSCPKQLTPGDKFVLIQSDPFDTKYFGAKVPDSSTLPSMSTPVQYNLPLSSTANAADNPSLAHAWAFYPSVYSCNVIAQGVSASTFSWTAASAGTSNAPQYASFQTQFEAFRPTAHAIRLSCPFAPTSTTGFVHIAIATETVYNSAGVVGAGYTRLPTSLSDLSGYTFYKRVTLASLTQSPITLINKWTDETAFRYISPFANQNVDGTGSALTFNIPFQWGALIVAVEGISTDTTAGKVITPLQAEVVLHTECIPDKASTLLGSTPAAFSAGLMSSVSQAVANTDFAHTEDQQESTIRSYLNEVQSSVGERFNSAVAHGMQYAERQGQSVLNRAISGGLGAAYRYLNPNRGYQNINGPRLLGITNS